MYHTAELAIVLSLIEGAGSEAIGSKDLPPAFRKRSAHRDRQILRPQLIPASPEAVYPFLAKK